MGSVFVSENDSFIPTLQIKHFKNELNYVIIDENDMLKALLSLNTSKSPGPDNMHPLILKELATFLSYPLTKLFEKSLSVGRIPNKWKLAEVKPLFKKGKKLIQATIDL